GRPPAAAGGAGRAGARASGAAGDPAPAHARPPARAAHGALRARAAHGEDQRTQVLRGRGRLASSTRFRRTKEPGAPSPLMPTREQLADLDPLAAVGSATGRIIPRGPLPPSAANAIARHRPAVAAVGVLLALMGAALGVVRKP